MQLSSVLVTLLLSTASVTSGATISRRAPGNFADLEGTDEAWQRNTDYCQTQAANRRRAPDSLTARAQLWSEVLLGLAVGSTYDNIGYNTKGLVTCFAAAVTGTTPDGSKYKVLGNFQVSKLLADDEWKDFEAMVKDQELSGLKGFISYPNITSTPKDDQGNPKAWGDDDQKLSGDYFNLLTQKIEGLTGTFVRSVGRDMDMPANASIETVVVGDEKLFKFKSNSIAWYSE